MTGRPTIAVAVHDGFDGCGTWHRAAAARLEAAGADVFPVRNAAAGMDRWGQLGNFRALVSNTADVLREKVIPDADPLLVIAFDVPFLGLAEALPADVRRSLVLVLRSSGRTHTPWDRERIAWERASLLAGLEDGARVAAISGYMRRHLRGEYGVPPGALFELRDGLVPEDRPVPWSAPSPPFLLCFGRAEPYKGYEDLLDALELLAAEGFPLSHLVLAATTEGTEPTEYQRSLRRRVEQLGLDATIISRFDGTVRGLLAHPELRAVVVPARVEPFGRIPVEAFLGGVAAVVATTAGGLAEQVVEEVTGFTAPPGSPRCLASAIRRTLCAASTKTPPAAEGSGSGTSPSRSRRAGCSTEPSATASPSSPPTPGGNAHGEAAAGVRRDGNDHANSADAVERGSQAGPAIDDAHLTKS